MGASSSTQRHVSPEQSEVESLAASRGALPLLQIQNAFSKLAHPQTKALPLQSLQQCFSLNYENLICEAPPVADSFKGLLDHLGPSIADLFFVPGKGGLSWVEFVRGYVKCCGRMPASTFLNTLLRVFATTFDRAGRTLKLEFESGDADCKISGFLLPIDVLMIFWMFRTMWWDARTRKFSKGKDDICLPDVNHLVLSAVVSCAEVGSDFNFWDCNISELEVQLPEDNFLTWTLTTVPSLADCFTEFVNARLQSSVASESPTDISTSSLGEISSTKAQDTHLLSPGRAWTISLTLRNSINEELLKLCCPIDGEEAEENLLYRSSLHGRGLNRFWSNIEGKEKNFVYSHIHPTGRVYEPHPKPLGIAFGGTIGNKRIFIDEDFSRVTVRHHAFDKTYQHGSLIPHQGFLPVESLISEVEEWGVGGRSVKQMQMSYKKREELFTEQRRKVDLKKFASWEDSPEKMMMDMMSNPNAVRRREDR